MDNDNKTYATQEQIDAARVLYADDSDDNIEVDDDAQSSLSVGGEGTWVQAWVWLPNDECEEESP